MGSWARRWWAVEELLLQCLHRARLRRRPRGPCRAGARCPCTTSRAQLVVEDPACSAALRAAIAGQMTTSPIKRGGSLGLDGPRPGCRPRSGDMARADAARPRSGTSSTSVGPLRPRNRCVEGGDGRLVDEHAARARPSPIPRSAEHPLSEGDPARESTGSVGLLVGRGRPRALTATAATGKAVRARRHGMGSDCPSWVEALRGRAVGGRAGRCRVARSAAGLHRRRRRRSRRTMRCRTTSALPSWTNAMPSIPRGASSSADQPRAAPGHVDLGDVAGDDHLGAEADAG